MGSLYFHEFCLSTYSVMNVFSWGFAVVVPKRAFPVASGTKTPLERLSLLKHVNLAEA